MSDFLGRLREREIPDWLRALYGVVYLVTFIHAILTRGAWTCCPPAYGDLETFAHAVQTAFGWTAATVSAMEGADNHGLAGAEGVLRNQGKGQV